jgi:hypothetical protein
MRITIADIQLLRKGLAKGGHKPTSHKILIEISLSLKHEQYAPRPRIVLRRAGIQVNEDLVAILRTRCQMHSKHQVRRQQNVGRACAGRSWNC